MADVLNRQSITGVVGSGWDQPPLSSKLPGLGKVPLNEITGI